MSYSLYGMVGAVGLIAVVSGFAVADRNTNYKPVKASVFVIERECRFDRVWDDGKHESVSDSCDATEEFKELAKASPAQRKKSVDGTAVVKVSYNAPQDGSYQTSQLKFTGRDEEFYKLKAGDQIDVLVSNKDLTKIIKA